MDDRAYDTIRRQSNCTRLEVLIDPFFNETQAGQISEGATSNIHAIVIVGRQDINPWGAIANTRCKIGDECRTIRGLQDTLLPAQRATPDLAISLMGFFHVSDVFRADSPCCGSTRCIG